ncbi:Putative secreted protein [Streptomyces clavuligerus]|uniref:Putative secreted protein n=2 Tax=Streptomyces clavuligerus TaxID=1901 RepID=E2Q3J7_STRCL|nr:Putative secreted protein [Streptomyces clavuligerus]
MGVLDGTLGPPTPFTVEKNTGKTGGTDTPPDGAGRTGAADAEGAPMEVVITLVVLLLFALLALGAYATSKAVKAAKRGVERTVTQAQRARRTVEDTALRAKSYGQGGPAAELAQLRLKLRTSMRATQDALHAGAEQDASLSESIALFERLSTHGHELDEELKRLEREPDRAAVSSRLPELKERTERIVHSAESLRWAARDRAQKFADDELDLLSAEIDMEAGALRHWSAAETGADPAEGPPGRSAGTADGGPAAAGTGGTAGQDRPEPGAADGTGEPRAITASDPQQRMTYSWEKATRKTTRPETTN